MQSIFPGSIDIYNTHGHSETAGIRRLWAAKILRHMQDALRPDNPRNAPPLHKSRGWFGTQSFRFTCQMANIDHTAVLAEYERRLKIGIQGDWPKATDGLADARQGF